VGGWLTGERASVGGREQHRGNFGEGASSEVMVGCAHRRHGVGQPHEEAKGLLGRDQHRGRPWGGSNRNSVLVTLAYGSLVIRERERGQEAAPRGRPRGDFPPEARPQTPASA
jgi:hypothetical protein